MSSERSCLAKDQPHERECDSSCTPPRSTQPATLRHRARPRAQRHTQCTDSKFLSCPRTRSSTAPVSATAISRHPRTIASHYAVTARVGGRSAPFDSTLRHASLMSGSWSSRYGGLREEPAHCIICTRNARRSLSSKIGTSTPNW